MRGERGIVSRLVCPSRTLIGWVERRDDLDIMHKSGVPKEDAYVMKVRLTWFSTDDT